MGSLDNALFEFSQFILEVLKEHWYLNELGLAELIGLFDSLFRQRFLVVNRFVANTEPTLPLVVRTSK
jgi:hypothetical protein